MKTAPAALLALSLAAAGAAWAAPPVNPPAGIPRRADLKINLNSPFLISPQFDLPKGPYADVDAAMADLKSSADALKEARKAYDDARESCKTKSYTPQDMQEACAPSDTVEVCSEKLYGHCLGNSYRAIKMAGLRLQAADAKLEKAIKAVLAGANKKTLGP